MTMLMKLIKPLQPEIELFKKEFAALRSHIDEKESEEFHKNLIINFLNAVYYKDKHYINTKNRKDLVIHHENSASSPVGVLIETKSPTNKSEMVSQGNFNVKSFQELVLYYLQERKTEKNFELCHLIITNIYEWFIFDAQDFEKLFYQNKALLHRFEQFSSGKLSGTKTDFFYKEIAAPEIQKLQAEIPYTYFDIRDCDDKLLDLYKFLHPVSLLKLQSPNDNNQLNKEFYSELLHIIGLEEEAKEGRKLLVYKKAGNEGSLIETAMHHIKSDEREVLNDSQLGENKEERAYNASFRLAIIWINRILFLKLLEAQICKYHKKDKHYAFLSTGKLENYSDLNELFFSVLAVKTDARQPEHLKAKFSKVPYLNSSLFEQTDIERNSIYIRALGHISHFAVYPKSVLKNEERPVSHLEYLLRFLDAYNFSGDDSDNAQSKPLISASVLGLIFEKINGYKDGSFFTPSFITMYMCRETIGRAVVQKFNEAKGWNCQSIEDLRNHIGKNTEDIKEANGIFNTVRICDPAVGSGHFLVSALNEMIYLKYKLEILAGKDGKRLKSYNIEVIGDELAITDSDGNGLAYNHKDSESQWVQEVLFNEKRTIIENCLFGVDVNPNSVDICRLRLWIELLKNAYYRDGGKGELETLPNIDINIKHGNSLISRFDLYEKYAELDYNAQRKLQDTTREYKEQVFLYKNCTDDRDAKKVIFKKIGEIKRTFNEINDRKDADFSKWMEAKNKYDAHAYSIRFGDDKIEWEKKLEELQKEEDRLKKIYQKKMKNAFEWSFEFPEVMDDDGNFVGFDIIIGNPPYMMLSPNDFIKYEFTEGNNNTYVAFNELAIKILSKDGLFSMIEPTTWFSGDKFKKFRTGILKNYNLKKIIQLPYDIFEDAYVDTAIVVISKENPEINTKYYKFNIRDNHEISNLDFKEFPNAEWLKFGKIFLNKDLLVIGQKVWLSNKNVKLREIADVDRGCLPPKENEISNQRTDFYNIQWFNGQIFRYTIKKQDKDTFVNYNNLRENKPIYLYQTKKILARQLMSRQFRMNLTYIEEEFAFKKNLYAIYNLKEEFDYKYILAILNSKLFSFMQINFNTSLQRDDFPAFSLNDFREFLIPKIPKENQQPFINLVNQILSAKKKNPAADTTEMEREIDRLVYGLYGITDQKDIGIIEGG
ncbi:hypothetical protein R83H12_00465 [Fibrobacteria bacterium R8-3-H12]